MNNKAVFAGTFDPFTLGHYEIAERAAKQFTTLYVAVADGSASKASYFSIKKRLRIAQLSLAGLKNVVVVPFKGFLVDFMRENGINVLVRGLRNAADFEYEKMLFCAYRSRGRGLLSYGFGAILLRFLVARKRSVCNGRRRVEIRQRGGRRRNQISRSNKWSLTS